MREFIRPIPAHSMAHQPPPRAAAESYINNTVEPRNPAGPPWINKILSLFKVELVKLG